MGVYQALRGHLSRLFPSDTVVQERYNAFMALLEHDHNAHAAMAKLEEIYYGQVPVEFKGLQDRYDTLSGHVREIINALVTVSSKPCTDLAQFYRMIDGFGRHLFYQDVPDISPPFALAMDSSAAGESELTGGKASALSILARETGLAVPRGFAVTTRAFNCFIDANKLREPIDDQLARLDISSPRSLEQTSQTIIEILRAAEIPHEVESAVSEMAAQIWPPQSSGRENGNTGNADNTPAVAVRSSALGEDGTVSFAGQYRSLVNVSQQDILSGWRKVIESKYSPRALNYRVQCGFLDAETPMAVLVLEMVRPDISGVMYTRPPEGGNGDEISIHSVYGLGELLVDGRAMPEVVRVDRELPLRVSRREQGRQSQKAVPAKGGGTCLVDLAPDRAGQPVLDEPSALALARAGIALETLFDGPQDVEWCIRKDGTMVLLQSRPLRARTVRDAQAPECTFEDVAETQLASGGRTACAGVAAGLVKHVRTDGDINAFPRGGVLVAAHALPDFARIISRISAVVIEEGSVAGHFASVAREFGVPCIVGLEKALEMIPDAAVVTVNAVENTVFQGESAPLLANPCAVPRPLSDSPFMRRFSFLMRFVSPLELVDPAAGNFTPTGCRSLHDIIRYSHETAVNAMFQIGSNRWFTTRGVKKLDPGIPVKINVLDVGQGLSDAAAREKTIGPDQIQSRPMTALLKGLLHPGIQWGDFSHFNWEEHDRIVMNGGIISPDDAMFASHAILARDYANLNLKFGYHFVIVDALCSDAFPENQIRFRFSGGGAAMDKRMLRARFLDSILSWLDFKVNITHDLVDGVFVSGDTAACNKTLEMTGRLLGATRLMDMYLKSENDLDRFVRDFKNGIYHYAGDL